MKLRKGLFPPVISFYTMARCLFIFLNIVDINAIGRLGVSLKVNLITSAKFSKRRKKKDFEETYIT